MSANKSQKYATIFQDIWLSNRNYKDWLGRAKCNTDAFCKLCHKELSISAMGESAIKSHVKGKLHLPRVTNESITSFFSRIKESDNSDKPSFSSLTSCGKDQTIDSMIVSNDSIKPEIM